jgi:hypothetical protein
MKGVNVSLAADTIGTTVTRPHPIWLGGLGTLHESQA